MNLGLLLSTCQIEETKDNIYRRSNWGYRGTDTEAYGSILFTSNSNLIPSEYKLEENQTSVLQMYWSNISGRGGNKNKAARAIILDKIAIHLLRSALTVGDVLDLYEAALHIFKDKFHSNDIIMPDSISFKKDYNSLPDINLHKLLPRKMGLQPYTKIFLGGNRYFQL